MLNLTLARWLLRRGVSLTLVGMLILAAIPFGPASGFAQSGDATPVATENAELLSVEGKLITLSPDGNWIAGINEADQFCIWDVATLSPQCVPDAHPIDVVSLTWAPGSDAVAFSLDAARLLYDSDIYLIELDPTSGTMSELHNLTDDGYEGSLLDYTEDELPPVDVMPTWTPDGTALVFARSLFDEWTLNASAVYQLDRAGGEPEVLFTLAGPPFSITTPMAVLDDGSIVYTYYLPGQNDRRNGVWRSTPEGRTVDLFADATPDSRLDWPILAAISADGSQAILFDFYGDSNGDRSQILFSLSVDDGHLAPMTSRNDAERVEAVSVSAAGGRHLLIANDGDGSYIVRDAADLDGEPLLQFDSDGNLPTPNLRTIDWSAQDTVLIPLQNGDAWLLDVRE